MGSRRTVKAVVCAAVWALTPASARAGDGQPAHVTDPHVLTSLGFPPDARNVYAFLDRLNQPVRGAASEPTDYYGGTASGFTNYTGMAFQPRSSTSVFGTCDDAEDLRHASGDNVFQVQLDVPNGARLEAVRWWAFDTETTADLNFTLDRICLPNQTPGSPSVTVLASQSTLGSSGNQSGEMSANATVDAKTCSYRIRALFGQNNCGMKLYRVRAQWVRQVSTAPPTARFLDVPTNHPFFRFVEALASSGITGGCSPNQYCPDSPVTRGQMAVFLATALGLNWGGL